MFDVIVAIDSCMICGFLSYGSVFDQKEDSLRQSSYHMEIIVSLSTHLNLCPLQLLLLGFPLVV